MLRGIPLAAPRLGGLRGSVVDYVNWKRARFVSYDTHSKQNPNTKVTIYGLVHLGV